MQDKIHKGFLKMLKSLNEQHNVGKKSKRPVPIFSVIYDDKGNTITSAMNAKAPKEKGVPKEASHAEYIICKSKKTIASKRDKVIYISAEPCEFCAKEIFKNKTIKKVVFLIENKKTKDKTHLNKLNIEVFEPKSDKQFELARDISNEFIKYQEYWTKKHKRRKMLRKGKTGSATKPTE